MTLSSSQFPEVYQSLDIDIQELGCIMLDLANLPLLDYVPQDHEEDLYFSPTQTYVQGLVADHKAHVTLLFGLLARGSDWQHYVDAVLKDWKRPSAVTVDHVSAFPSRTEGEDYSAIIAHIKVDDALLEGHDRLRLLPHIDTFPEYLPHMTLAYVKGGATTEWIEQLSDLNGKKLAVTGLNYGG